MIIIEIHAFTFPTFQHYSTPKQLVSIPNKAIETSPGYATGGFTGHIRPVLTSAKVAPVGYYVPSPAESCSHLPSALY